RHPREFEAAGRREGVRGPGAVRGRPADPQPLGIHAHLAHHPVIAPPALAQAPIRPRRPLAAAVVRSATTLATAIVVALLALPLLALLFRTSPAQLWARLGDPVVLSALRLSLVTSLVAT